MTASPAISVVLPTYNHLRFLPAAIADIVAQTRTDWELIVIDDGSTDGTGDWLAATPLDGRIRWLRQGNAGPDQAINAGIAAARGQYVTWVSADNRSAPYFLEALAAALDCEASAQLAYSPYYALDAEDRVAALKFDNVLLLRDLVTGAPRGMTGFLYRRALHAQIGWYEGLTCDTRMWARIVESFPTVFVLEPTCYYRFHNDRASVRQGERLARERPSVTPDFLARHVSSRHTDGSGVEALLRLLYPGLAAMPDALPAAAADAAIRFAEAGAAETARAFAEVGLREASAEALWAPLLAGLSCALRTGTGTGTGMGTDPVEMVIPALLANAALTEPARDAAMAAAVALAELVQEGGFGAAAARVARLDGAHPLCLAERPRVFSYAAWKLGFRATPLPAF